MASELHGIARTTRIRTEEQRQQELDRIAKYRDLEAQVRSHRLFNSSICSQEPNPETETEQEAKTTREDDSAATDLFHLTSTLLHLNPEYHTIWNVRRRMLICGLFSKRPFGCSPSTAYSTSSMRGTTTTPCGARCTCYWERTPWSRPSQMRAGRSGTRQGKGRGGNGGMTEQGGEAEEDERDEGDRAAAAQSNDLAVLDAELDFTLPLLLEHPKSYWLWNHRRWLLQQSVERLPARPHARRVWEDELGLVTKMLARDRRNFHAWGYRRFVVGSLEGPGLDGASMAEAEFSYTTRMIRADLSNFSAWHARSKLMPRLLGERHADGEARKRFFDEELAIIRSALNVGPEDQSLWLYHQFLVFQNLVSPYPRSSSASSSCIIDPPLPPSERAAYLTSELDDIRELLDDYDDVKWIYEVLTDYTLALARQVEGRGLTDGEKKDMRSWLAKLRELDPMRNGRWGDVERECGLEE